MSLLAVADENSNVLASGDQQILNILLIQSTPSCPLESMIHCSVAETTFHQMHSSFSIPFGPTTAGLRSSALNLLIVDVTLNRPPVLRACTLTSKPTASAHFSIASVEQVMTIRILGTLQWLSRWTGVGIRLAVVVKRFFLEDALPISRVAVDGRQICHVGTDSTLLARRKVIVGPVLGVANNGGYFLAGVLFMLLDQLHQFVVFTYIARRRA